MRYCKCLANLWIEGMKAPLRHIKWITSGKHCTPEQLRLPFHSESTHCKNQRTYTTSTKYILVYTRMSLHICVYNPIYCNIYGHILLRQSIYSDILICTLHIRAYILIYCDILTYTTSTKYILVYTRMYSVYLCTYY